jgi:hypothetical protein
MAAAEQRGSDHQAPNLESTKKSRELASQTVEPPVPGHSAGISKLDRAVISYRGSHFQPSLQCSVRFEFADRAAKGKRFPYRPDHAS